MDVPLDIPIINHHIHFHSLHTIEIKYCRKCVKIYHSKVCQQVKSASIGIVADKIWNNYSHLDHIEAYT